MAATPNYTFTPFCPSVQISVANANRNGTGAIVDMTVAPAGGARIDDLKIVAVGTTTVGKVRMYRKSGGVYQYMEAFDVTAITVSATVDPWAQDVLNMPIILEAGQCLAFSTEKAETFNIIVTRGGAF